MNDNWEVKKLIDVCNIQYGYAFDSSCFCDDNSYPQLIRIRDVVRGYSETFYKGYIPEGYYINKGDYLIGMDGEFHIAPWQSEKALLNQRVCKISASDCNVDERFIFYKMSVVLKQIEDETPFVTVKHLSAKRLNLVKLPIPPLPEQSRIVEELDLLSNIIEKKRQQLSELDNLAQSIFYDMFGDPVTNEKGWEVKKLGEVYAINPSKKITLIGIKGDDMVSFLPMEDLPIKACYVTPKQNRTCNEVMSSYTCFANNDVLLAKVTPCFENGKVGIASNLINGVGFGSSEFIVIRPKELAVKEYVYHLVQTDNFVEKACKQFTGTSGLRRVPKQFVE